MTAWQQQPFGITAVVDAQRPCIPLWWFGGFPVTARLPEGTSPCGGPVVRRKSIRLREAAAWSDRHARDHPQRRDRCPGLSEPWVLQSSEITFGNAASGRATTGSTPGNGAADRFDTFGRCRNLLSEVAGQDSVPGRRSGDHEKRPPRASGRVCGVRHRQVPDRRL